MSLYQNFYNAYVKRHADKKKQTCQQECNRLWKDAKLKFTDKDVLNEHINKEILKLRNETVEKKAQTMLSFIPKGKGSSSTVRNEDEVRISSSAKEQLSTSTPSDLDHSSASSKGGETKVTASLPLPTNTKIETYKRKMTIIELSDDEIKACTSSTPLKRHTPAQDSLKKKISKLRTKLDLTERRKKSVLADGTEHKTILKLRRQIDQIKKKLKQKKQQCTYSKNFRESHKNKLLEILSKDSQAAESFKLRAAPGRPRLEEQQPNLLKTITDIALFGASAEERRRCEIFRTCHTLSDLHAKLLELGFNISRSGTYIRLLPKKSNTSEAKRHVVTVPVKLSRPEADNHNAHQDQNFCLSSIRSLETVASILGPDTVIFISQDDKARVPIGLTAANKQAPLLMHVEYKVSLPDHDFVIASQHKLIPSVYAICEIKRNEMGRPEAVTYSGPTYIAIRSAKHSSSTATSHSDDLNTLLSSDDFQTYVKDSQGKVKPILIISCDGGPDENPRYPKVIAHAINHFKKYDLDGIFIVTNAPGRSAFNRVERRMAPLSRELTGLILPHEYYGSHLDHSGKTISSTLERENFQKAGEVLSEVWNSVVIDGHKVVAKYITPEGSVSSIPDIFDEKWYADHVRESQYLLQVVKCDSRECCGSLRSALHNVVPQHFIPPPYPIVQFNGDLTIPEPREHDGKSFAPFLLCQSLKVYPKLSNLSKMPYDYYCPSLRANDQTINNRCCKTCGLYFASRVKLQKHCSVLHAIPQASTKVRPSRVVTRRNEELLCAEGDNLQWMPIEEVYISGDCFPTRQENVEVMCPIVTLEQAHESPWVEA